MKIGLKLWSTNIQYIGSSLVLYQRGLFNYIELFIVPNSGSSLNYWVPLKIPFVLHAPHFYTGFNLADASYETKNRILLKQIRAYFEGLRPRAIIFHPGAQGSLNETIRQIALFKKEFGDIFASALFENKPAVGLKDEKLIGSRPEEIAYLLQEANVGLCLDIGHAISAAAYYKEDPIEFIEKFLQLSPQLFHLADGHRQSIQDEHLHLGHGDYDLTKIVTTVIGFSSNYVTIETKKNSKENLNDFEQDIAFLRNLLNATD